MVNKVIFILFSISELKDLSLRARLAELNEQAADVTVLLATISYDQVELAQLTTELKNTLPTLKISRLGQHYWQQVATESKEELAVDIKVPDLTNYPKIVTDNGKYQIELTDSATGRIIFDFSKQQQLLTKTILGESNNYSKVVYDLDQQPMFIESWESNKLVQVDSLNQHHTIVLRQRINDITKIKVDDKNRVPFSNDYYADVRKKRAITSQSISLDNFEYNYVDYTQMQKYDDLYKLLGAILQLDGYDIILTSTKNIVQLSQEFNNRILRSY